MACVGHKLPRCPAKLSAACMALYRFVFEASLLNPLAVCWRLVMADNGGLSEPGAEAGEWGDIPKWHMASRAARACVKRVQPARMHACMHASGGARRVHACMRARYPDPLRLCPALAAAPRRPGALSRHHCGQRRCPLRAGGAGLWCSALSFLPSFVPLLYGASACRPTPMHPARTCCRMPCFHAATCTHTYAHVRAGTACGGPHACCL